MRRRSVASTCTARCAALAGAAPINRAIMAGDAESGVMVMKLDAGLDTGDVAMASGSGLPTP